MVSAYRKTFMATAAAAAMAFAGLSAGAPDARAQQRDILIGGGSVTGVYYQVALQTCALMNKYSGDSYNCVGRPALGSVFNVNAVNRGLLDFGVAQSDINYKAYKGEGEWDGSPVENLRSVFSAHPEATLVVTRDDTGIKSIGDLKGKTVNIGNPGSGQRTVSMSMLPLYGIDPEADINAEGLQQGEASRALVDQKIDAFIYVVGVPSAAIEEPANSTDIDILDVNSDAVKEYISDKPYYVMAKYPDGVFKGVDAFETYAVKATVITSSEVDEQVVYDYVKTVFENLEELKGTHAAFKILAPEDMLGGLSAPLHDGAVKYYKERGLM